MAEHKNNPDISLGNGFTSSLALQLMVELGPTEYMGKGVEGNRLNYPIIGGTFEGLGTEGIIVPGGADFAIEREDGTQIVSALYRIKTADNQIIIIDNRGIWRPDESAKARIQNGQEPLASQIYARTTPIFHTQPGPYAWLNDYIFFGTIEDPGKPSAVLIKIYRLN
ncbi:DUF3237 domain-containing protein [Amphritea pacifica]|uniref:DUF3237 domain-containing protein n=1 Tax=Amphritea pacifica TaxID=2811233 RepID=UPI001966BC19|nr:DUF3237 domain-containing protein [Amphritea pacifica]MBN1006252.1 DUF3237 domain-containing protein [Amphritea pacifica]